MVSENLRTLFSATLVAVTYLVWPFYNMLFSFICHIGQSASVVKTIPMTYKMVLKAEITSYWIFCGNNETRTLSIFILAVMLILLIFFFSLQNQYMTSMTNRLWYFLGRCMSQSSNFNHLNKLQQLKVHHMSTAWHSKALTISAPMFGTQDSNFGPKKAISCPGNIESHKITAYFVARTDLI